MLPASNNRQSSRATTPLAFAGPSLNQTDSIPSHSLPNFMGASGHSQIIPREFPSIPSMEGRAHSSPVKLSQAQAVPHLPEDVSTWLHQGCKDLVSLFKTAYLNAKTVNRQDVASHPDIQAFLRERGEALVQLPGFSKDLSGRFMLSRVNTQPKGSEGQQPSDTDGPLALSAYHTVAGLGEIICKAGAERWPAALEEHFIRVGGHNT